MRTLLTTDSVPAGQRVDYWQMVCSDILGTVEIKDHPKDGFHACLEVIEVDDIRIGRFEAVPQTIDRQKAQLKHSADDDFDIVLQADSVLSYDHNGQQRSNSGGILLFDVRRPYHSNHPDRVDVINFLVPRKKLEAALGHARLAAGLGIESTQASYPVLATFLRTLHASGASLSPASAARMSNIAVDLVAAGFAERLALDPPKNINNVSVLYRAKLHIDEHLGEAGLGMPEIAAASGVSVRRLQQIAKEEGAPISEWLWERRLTRARAWLMDPAHRSMAVGSIAHACGFIDQTHFSRRFKERFGHTPTECRAHHGLAAEARRLP